MERFSTALWCIFPYSEILHPYLHQLEPRPIATVELPLYAFNRMTLFASEGDVMVNRKPLLPFFLPNDEEKTFTSISEDFGYNNPIESFVEEIGCEIALGERRIWTFCNPAFLYSTLLPAAYEKQVPVHVYDPAIELEEGNAQYLLHCNSAGTKFPYHLFPMQESINVN